MTIKEWDGTGVPPVGTVCEYYWIEEDEWHKCEVVAYYYKKVVAVDVIDSEAVCLPPNLLRPIKTPEQIAEEKRLHAIEDMMFFVGRYSTFKDVMGKLYDAGYRKTEVTKCVKHK